MNRLLVELVNAEEKVAIEQWGVTDRTPEILLNAITEELGEVAHAINHEEGVASINQEIVETIGVLSRLYNMVNYLI